MTPDIEKITDAEKAYEEFAAQPLVKVAGGVDRASFCAGFGTCAEQYQNLEAALPAVAEALGDLLKHCDANPSGETAFERSVIKAREALALLEKKT